MGVEGGGISVGGSSLSIGGGVGVSAGPAGGGGPSIGGISAPSMEAGPAGGFGPSFVNEGPVGLGFLENTMPITLNNFKLLGEIIFNPVKGEEAPSIIGQAEEVAAAAWENSEPVSVIQQAEQVAAKVWEAPLASQVFDPETQTRRGETLEAQVPMEYTTFAIPDVIQAQKTKTALEEAGMVDLSTQVVNYLKPELKQAYQQTITIPTPIPQGKLVAQIVEEQEVVVDDKVDKNRDTREEEEVENIRLKNVVDIPVSEQRVYEIEQAADKAEAEAKVEGVEGIEGWRIVKFLPHQHPGNESGIIRNTGLRDGSLDETEQELTAKKFASKAEVKQRAAVLVSKEKPPVKQDKDGQLVEDQDVARVFKHNIFRPHPAKEVVLRIVKKRKVEVVKEAGQPAQVVSDVKSEVTEGRIEDYPKLAEVFPKAA